MEDWTEVSARKELIQERRRFEDNGWIAAADYLDHFIIQNNPGKDYTPDDTIVNYIKEQANSMVRRAIVYTLGIRNRRGPQDVRPQFRACNDFKLPTFDGLVRWMPTLLENAALAFWTGKEKSNLRDTNNGLFYAIGGARMIVKGTVTNIRPGVFGWDYDVRADVKIIDLYSFPDDIRAWGSDVYSAAAYLQNTLRPVKYKHFNTIVEWKNELYKDLYFS